MKSKKKFNPKDEVAKFVKSIAEAPESPYSGRAKTLYECFLTEEPREPDLIDEITFDTPTEVERYCDLVFRQQEHAYSFKGKLVWPGMPVVVDHEYKSLLLYRTVDGREIRHETWMPYSLNKRVRAYVMGVRTLYNGEVVFTSDDEPGGFKPDSSEQVIMVASGLHKKPFYVHSFEIET